VDVSSFEPRPRRSNVCRTASIGSIASIASIARTARRIAWTPAFAVLALAASTGCGDAPPPPPTATAPRTVRVHVTNESRFDICRVEACGQPGRAVDSEGVTPGNPPLKPHGVGMYEVRECTTRALVAVACPDPNEPRAPCLKAEGGVVQDGTMFRIAACAL
jgi:hypothetical protein